ncbi:MAG TPA: RluA family pseudouridine synthase [Pirellulaceae bacterium]|nr:RluA family pseudouridine synthase [Pirellulaceae bacterium]HMO92889.1 RluA family pseudouridine synthase [Pirellulaceae bacterium]HMP69167.1 RluA family pseudouridine synthase [Pirellulaceae bacterium]
MPKPARDQLSVVYEDNHLIVLDKPPMLATMGVSGNEKSLLTLAKDYIRQKYAKPGNVYLGVVSRLDSHSRGLVVFARTSKAAARLTEQFKAGTVAKRYLAIVSAEVADHGSWQDFLVKDEKLQRVVIASQGHPHHAQAKLARLEFTSLAARHNVRLVDIRLETGRKHQIRVQFASRGAPLIGDIKYGWRDEGEIAWQRERGIALLAYRLEFDHPTRAERMYFSASTPENWPFIDVIRQHISSQFSA